MKKKKASYFVGIAFICIIAVFFASVGYRVYRVRRYCDYGANASESVNTSQQGGKETENDDSKITMDFTWEEAFPFSDDYKFTPTVKSKQESVTESKEDSGSVSKYLSVVNKIKDSIDYYTAKLLPGRMKYVEINALFNKSVGMNIISGSDSVVVMKNGYLTFENSNSSDAAAQAESVEWFEKIMKKKGIDFAYIQYPTKEKEGDNQLPNGVTEGTNKTADNLLERLKKSGVACYDFRTLLSQKDDDWYSNFFKTDHHWKPETGVWAAGQIVNILNSDFGYKLDAGVGNLENYNVDVYEKYMFGAQGKVATLTYAEPEDISLIYPKKDTNITVTYNLIVGPQTGKFEDVLLNKDHLNNTDYYNYAAYAAYLNGNQALTQITNNNCKNGKEMLVIGDSYNKCVVPYLTQTFEQVDLLDRRYFSGSVIDYIDKMNPDVVIIAYMPSLIGSVDTHKSPFNFE